MTRSNMIKIPRPMPEEEVRFWADVQTQFKRMITNKPPLTYITKFADIIHFCRMGYELHTNGTDVYLQAIWDDGRVRVLAVNTAHDYTSFEFLANWKEQRVIADGKGAEKRKYNRLMYFKQVEAGNTENHWYSRYVLKITYTEIARGE